MDNFLICSCQDSLYTTNLEAFDVVWQDESTTTDYLIQEAGEYYLTVTDDEGCSFSDTIQVAEDLFPEEVAIDLAPTFCLGNELFLSSGFEDAETYLWSTDEGTPFIQPQESGEYWVEAVNANGCVGRDTVQVDIVGTAPAAAFGFSPPCENSEVVFDDLTVPDGGTVTEWEWVFGDAVSGSGSAAFGSAQAPAFANQYTTTGQYPVELTVTLDNGCTGTVRDTVLVNPLPLVNFSAPIVCAGNEVFFESLSAVPGGGTLAGQDWTFGNGTFDSGSVGSTVFENLGTNTVTHIVTTTDQCTDSLTRNVEVLGSPIADFEVEDICLGTVATFEEDVDVSVSGPVFYNWQFGDGFFSNFPVTSHEYAQPGVYGVTLTATGNNVGVNGCTDAITKEIRVYEPPSVAVTTSDACVGATTDLTDLTGVQSLDGTTDIITSREWSIIDGPTGTQQGLVGTDSAQVFVPDAAGTFEVELTLETASGCNATGTDQFLVQAIPTADFLLELPVFNPPITATPQNLSEDGINFEWLINGEAVSTAFEPELVFESAGDYLVELVATNDLNCNDTAAAQYTVIVPEYDIALIDLDYQIQGGKLTLNAIVANNGNVEVTDFNAAVNVGRDIDFNLNVDAVIPAGQIVNVPLGSEIGYLPGRDLPYACMRISDPNGQTETDTTNNYLCKGLNETSATFAAPYPNPAQESVRLTFILPEAGPLEVEVTAADGRMIEDFTLDLKEGLNTVDYPLTGWSEGMYFLKFVYRNQDEVHRLVIAR